MRPCQGDFATHMKVQCKDSHSLVIRHLGITEFEDVWHEMQRFTLIRNGVTKDEIWITEHLPVYTMGLNAREVGPFESHGIPVVKTDRGGKATYHGPGQMVIYLLLDLGRMQLPPKALVEVLEQGMLRFLAEHQVYGRRIDSAPGVYVEHRKIASIGLRIKNGCSYHGISVNVDMDLSPFSSIDPCGFKGLEMTQLRNVGITTSKEDVASQLIELYEHQLYLERRKAL